MLLLMSEDGLTTAGYSQVSYHDRMSFVPSSILLPVGFESSLLSFLGLFVSRVLGETKVRKFANLSIVIYS